MRTPRLGPAFLLVLACLLPARGEEGMWLFNAPPREQIRARYGFDLNDRWLDHLMKASVRFNSGGSGSFVSANGLVITNHHVGLDALQKMSDERRNFVRDGFLARSPADEARCLDLELDVLQSIEDVTARVKGAVPAGVSGRTAFEARRRAIAAIERESHDRTGLRSDVVTLYQGGAYHLYRYHRYTDVRLVFAPEQQAAFFGGDPDNFEYPRYDLDVCLFRVYENARPVRPSDFLAWSPRGARDGELVFISGNPGQTERLLTVAELEFLRDVRYPQILDTLRRREVVLGAWSARSEENARRARELLFGVQNSRKVRAGMLAVLQDPRFMGAKRAAEAHLEARLRSLPGGEAALAAIRGAAAAEAVVARHYLRYRLLEGERGRAQGFYSDSFEIARTLLRAADEQAKPDGERLEEYADPRRESLELGLFSPKPIYEDLEILRLTDSLAQLTEQLGSGDPLVARILAGKSARDRASELIRATRVGDVAFRHRLYGAGSAAVAAAGDPLVELARLVDAEARAARLVIDTQDEIRKQAHDLIGQAQFRLDGASASPDATFTLRLAYGTVRGYEEDGRPVPAFTTLAGLLERAAAHGGREPFDLPPRWAAAKSALDAATPFDFVTTCDSVGGNSGSPTVNRACEFVGILFDGNLQSLSEDLAYDDIQSRSVSVGSSAILEALRRVYGAGLLADELAAGRR